ncbi:Peptidase M16C associated domain protein [Solidesulfovibrio carbinoliphilus subsp. oakridgensis]|uniref:Peptidase M16C associated domain protein n=1 Tax=Solidesulfovibrio carbinoliphilus subsp. oakridgensis TaxID=694327 RepID=G7Q9M4_9BACT|nr:insulinase family protein [Solidesulfovibrio carbinoliphilus]EHJ48664.1 Peptidase M16C associated domain protein [Solidesulfovibrio carbinoliphilus subsp. oakridgensis]
MSRSHGFTVLADETLTEYAARAVRYRHDRTGAEVLSLSLDDANKVFGVAFRTPPANSTGVPHILEHSVLCGSRKYPVKEPFVELLKGSLQTFLNAFTYPDKTCYPVASTNLPDFYNLVDVYLDAVFFPRIPRHVFLQEGWHFEWTEAGELSRSGVVFNEMKGVYSSPDSVLGEFSQRLLFPDTTYGVDSGGDPKVIPTLTYEEFKAFHETYYHPSNARAFFSGDDDPEERLRLLDDYFSRFDARPVDSHVALQEPFAAPRRTEMPYAAAPGQADRAFVTVNWLLPDTADQDRVLVLDVLEHVLIGLPTSPLRKALVDSGLGEDLAGGGLETELRQMFFSVGLKGIKPGTSQEVENLVRGTLTWLADGGLPADAVEAGVNALEFALRENNTGSFPRGLSLMLRALTTWLHDGDPLAPLRFSGPLSRLKDRLAAGEPVLEQAIREYFLDNPHQVTLTLAPDTELDAKRLAAEKEELAAVAAGLDEAGRQKITAIQEELRRLQETPDSPEDLAKIPGLALADLPVVETPIPQEARAGQAATVLLHPLETAGIGYLDLVFPLDGVPDRLVGLVPLFGRALLELGTDRRDAVALTRRIAAKTGGISREAMTASLVGAGPDAVAAKLVFRGKATGDKVPDLLDILEEILTATDFGNRERFTQMAMEARSRLERRLAPAGHATAGSRLRARYTLAGNLSERMRGISQLLYLRELEERITADYDAVRRDLETLREVVLTRAGLVAGLTASAGDMPRFEAAVSGFLDRLPAAAPAPAVWERLVVPGAEGIAIPAQVHYVGVGLDLAATGWTFDGADLVAARYLRMAYLWDRVRVRGGAYGAFCSLDRLTGQAVFVSYRDPNTEATIDIFRGAGRYLMEEPLSDAEMTRAVIGAIGDIDSHMLPDAKGHVALVRRLIGDTPEVRAAMRAQVLAAGTRRFREFGEALDAAAKNAGIVVLGPTPSLDALRVPGLVRLDVL